MGISFHCVLASSIICALVFCGIGQTAGDRQPVAGVLPEPSEGLKVTLLKAGSCSTREFAFYPNGGWERIDVPAMFALIEHPVYGPVLFDTGYAPRFYECTHPFPFRLIALATPATVTDADTAGTQLDALGIEPASVKWIILSHFDPDHSGGLKDFPNARIVCSSEAWDSVKGKEGFAAFRIRLLPGQLPNDIADRLVLLPEPSGTAIGNFPHSLDLFDDHSISLVELPGHATGQLGAFVKRTDGVTVFLAADGCWNLAMIENETFRGGIHRLLAMDRKEQDTTYDRLRRFHREYPDVIIVPSHCPRTWQSLSSDYNVPLGNLDAKTTVGDIHAWDIGNIVGVDRRVEPIPLARREWLPRTQCPPRTRCP